MKGTAKEKTKITVRHMEVEDIDTVLDLDRRITGTKRTLTYTDPVTTYVGGELGISWVAEAEGRIIGFILGRLSQLLGTRVPRIGLIELVGVGTKWRHRGIARQLVEAFCEDCRQKGAVAVHIIISPEDEDLRLFFHTQAFRPRELIHLQRKLEA